MTNIYQFEAELLDGKNKSFADYEGEVLLIVNTASKCGFTPQFAGLEKIYEQYHAQGFEVLGFPCNQFGGQDPGSNEQIGTYCQKNYGVTFPMFSKVDVKGPEAHAIFRYLTNNSKGILGSGIKWNFTKFLIGKDGKVINRYAPTTKPEAIQADIEKALTTHGFEFVLSRDTAKAKPAPKETPKEDDELGDLEIEDLDDEDKI
jgi:glutathione peroxidase